MLTPYYPTPTTVYARMLLAWSWKIQTTSVMLIEGRPKRCISPTHHDRPPMFFPSPQIPPTAFALTIRESTLPSVLKRHRLDSDVDGENSVGLQRKKRRLRLHLVTSRLSQPYATPPTHILSRKSGRPASWMKPRNRVRSPLRRAAILNAIRIRRAPARGFGPKEADLLTGLRPQKESIHTEVELITQGVRTSHGPMPDGCSPQRYLPSSPSPLGPSNYYDALDDDDDSFGEDDSDELDEGGTVYSDFNDLDGTATESEDYDTYSPFSGEEEDCHLWTPAIVDEPVDIYSDVDRKTKNPSASCAS